MMAEEEKRPFVLQEHVNWSRHRFRLPPGSCAVGTKDFFAVVSSSSSSSSSSTTPPPLPHTCSSASPSINQRILLLSSKPPFPLLRELVVRQGHVLQLHYISKTNSLVTLERLRSVDEGQRNLVCIYPLQNDYDMKLCVPLPSDDSIATVSVCAETARVVTTFQDRVVLWDCSSVGGFREILKLQVPFHVTQVAIYRNFLAYASRHEARLVRLDIVHHSPSLPHNEEQEEEEEEGEGVEVRLDDHGLLPRELYATSVTQKNTVLFQSEDEEHEALQQQLNKRMDHRNKKKKLTVHERDAEQRSKRILLRKRQADQPFEVMTVHRDFSHAVEANSFSGFRLRECHVLLHRKLLASDTIRSIVLIPPPPALPIFSDYIDAHDPVLSGARDDVCCGVRFLLCTGDQGLLYDVHPSRSTVLASSYTFNESGLTHARVESSLLYIVTRCAMLVYTLPSSPSRVHGKHKPLLLYRYACDHIANILIRGRYLMLSRRAPSTDIEERLFNSQPEELVSILERRFMDSVCLDLSLASPSAATVKQIDFALRCAGAHDFSSNCSNARLFIRIVATSAGHLACSLLDALLERRRTDQAVLEVRRQRGSHDERADDEEDEEEPLAPERLLHLEEECATAFARSNCCPTFVCALLDGHDKDQTTAIKHAYLLALLQDPSQRTLDLFASDPAFTHAVLVHFAAHSPAMFTSVLMQTCLFWSAFDAATVISHMPVSEKRSALDRLCHAMLFLQMGDATAARDVFLQLGTHKLVRFLAMNPRLLTEWATRDALCCFLMAEMPWLVVDALVDLLRKSTLTVEEAIGVLAHEADQKKRLVLEECLLRVSQADPSRLLAVYHEQFQRGIRCSQPLIEAPDFLFDPSALLQREMWLYNVREETKVHVPMLCWKLLDLEWHDYSSFVSLFRSSKEEADEEAARLLELAAFASPAQCFESLLDHYPQSLVPFAEKYCKENSAKWREGMSVFTLRLTQEHNQLDAVLSLYKQVLQHLVDTKSPQLLLDVIPDDGQAKFFLPFVERAFRKVGLLRNPLLE